MSLKDEIEKLIKAKRRKLESRAREQELESERRCVRFQPLRALLEELIAAADKERDPGFRCQLAFGTLEFLWKIALARNLVNFLADALLIRPLRFLVTYENLTLSGMIRRTDQALVLHALDERCGTVIADAKPALNVAG
jgi:hypothetical protein